jgi:HK97 family phage major capsid protein
MGLQEATPTFAVLAREDWESIELEKGTDDRYLWVSVNDGGVQRLWRMPVIETTLMPANSWMIGDGSAAQLFDRQTATIEVFEQDEDNVQRNMLTIRVEERILLAKYRPSSFVKGTAWA